MPKTKGADFFTATVWFKLSVKGKIQTIADNFTAHSGLRKRMRFYVGNQFQSSSFQETFRHHGENYKEHSIY